MTSFTARAPHGRPRVLVFAHSSGLSGAERSLLETLQLLVADHDISVVVPWGGPFTEAVRRLPVCGVHVIAQHSWYQESGRSTWKKLAKILLALGAVARAALLVARTRPDVVYSNSIGSWTGALAARLCRVSHVWHLRELPRPDLLGDPIFGRRLERWVLSHGRTVHVCNSGFVRDWYREAFGLDATVAYQPVQVPAVPVSRRASGPVAMAVFGRLHASKRQHVVVEAIARLPAHLRGRVELHLYGEPLEPYASQLEALVAAPGLEGRIQLHGFTPRPHEAMAASDVVVVPSVDEPFGRVCVEAMLLGVPVIGSDSGGTLEVIGTQCRHGTLFRTDDAAALADAIAGFLADPAPFAARAKEAKGWARQTFSAAAYVQRIRAAFDAARALPKSPAGAC